MQKFIIGIDTGGTYTDAVLIDTNTQAIVATSKKPTTHYKLSVATGEALAELLATSGATPEQIVKVVVSSTLATNAVVENRGARVAVIVIGFVKHFRLPVKAVVFVKGGHNIMGEEEQPLELDYLVQLIEGLKNEVDAYGICSAMSIKNPAHEMVAEKAISMLDPKPVFCSHRISNLTGMEQRAATAGLHAKLMPVMEEFISGVRLAMDGLKLHAPVMVIGGNGQPIEAQKATQEAGLTVASGPACTAHFGASHCKTSTGCLVIDVGGTTTDIAMIEEGHPLMSKEGCQIGQWKTHVEAIDMHTGGIGGDSHVFLDDKGAMYVGPSRVTPLAIAKDLPAVETWLGAAENNKLISLYPGVQNAPCKNELTGLLATSGSLTPAAIREKTGLSGIPLDKQLEQLTRQQLIFECGFTPTDALHVLGTISIGDRQVACKGAEILGSIRGVSKEQFALQVLDKTREQIENLIIDYVVKHFWGDTLTSFISTRNDHPVLGVDFSLKTPLIGIGAAAQYLLPEVAKNLKTTIFFPDFCEVGNAIGAAMIGMKEMKKIRTDESSLCR
ncbi:hydantoinase/oxoprolinase N-terminal domain-containing protein [Desulforhopalus sp. IMCC35007]|uniref:hydantoinase/oxoprolinase N-terminal domain-containing protein n=1 Tax=Desulforhopalus sp. IMCC35007 TaxID=2569543 RepID=UPI0010AE65F3|nr:hydantoinase/oxoprolinase family protein [Desulforhopalus sp. IMCC35007]TKB11701.1 hydantoinase/oxoprolinase family protein [Desulforhopalus sp. IMCC35007]